MTMSNSEDTRAGARVGRQDHGRRWTMALAVALTAHAALGGEKADRFEWPAWSIPAQGIEERGALAIVDDDDAESKRTVEGDGGAKRDVPSALHQRVSRRAAAKGEIAVARTPAVRWQDAVPGVYRISARIKFDGDLGVIGTPIRLYVAIHPGHAARLGAHKEFTATDFKETDAYTEISLLYEVSPERDKRIAAREARNAWQTGPWYHEVYPDAPKEGGGGGDERGEGFYAGITLPKTKYQSYDGMPPNSMRWLRVDWIRMERIQPSPSITVRHVRPDKLWLRPGEANGFQIGVENFTDTAADRTLELVVEHGLNERMPIHTERVKLQAGEAKTISVNWTAPAQPPLWGCRALAQVRNSDGDVESAADDYFQVHPECYTVHIMGSNTRRVDPFRRRESYQNHVEVFAATPGDMSRILPKADAWFPGMVGGAIVYTFDLIRSVTGHNRQEGIMTAFYLFAGGTGVAVMDDYVAHPEWMAGKGIATDPVYSANRARLEELRAWDFARKGMVPESKNATPGLEIHLSHRYPELKQRIEREFVAFVRKTGYDAVRFDVGIMGPHGGPKTILGDDRSVQIDNAMRHAANNFNDLRAVVEAEFPHFEWGANMDTYGYLDTIMDREAEITPEEEYEEFVAFREAHGMFMDEGTMSAPLYDHYMNKWEDCWYFMNLKRAISQKRGGVYQLFSPHRNGKGNFCHDDIYFTLMTIASRSHYVGAYSAPLYSDGSMGAFATRFSEILWDPELQPLEAAEDLIVVDAPSPLWYAEAVVQKRMGDRMRYVIPLINPPVIERLRRNKVNELPPPIDEPFSVEIEMPDGYQSATAWMVGWEPRVAAVRLESEVRDDTLAVEFPELHLFRILVVEFDQ